MLPVRIGLTGGIGSGKSTVARLLAADGAYIVDADAIAREVVAAGTPGLAALAAEFGPGILAQDGELDRGSLAAVAFADSRNRAKLDAITHPLIQARTVELMSQVPPGAVIVHDVALLAELGLAPAYDLVVVVESPDDVRMLRLVERGLFEADIRRRIAAQASDEQRRATADVVIENSGDVDELRDQVDNLWARITATKS